MKVYEITSLEDINLPFFFQLTQEIYKEDPIWVPENPEEIKSRFNFSSSVDEIRTWPLVVINEEGKPTVRALAILHPRAFNKKNNKVGWISYLEILEGEYESLVEILDHCITIFKKENVQEIILPKLDNQYFGLQVSGFDKPQTILTTHNRDYYFKYLKKYGFKVYLNITSIVITREDYKKKFYSVRGINVRTFNRENLQKEIEIYHELTNAVFSNSYDYIPKTLEENSTFVKSFLPLLDDDLVIIAETENGKPVGFLIATPDYNQKIKEGRIDRARIISIGILPDYHKKNIGSAMISLLVENLLKKNYQSAEGSIIMKSNLPPQLLAKRFGSKPGREFALLKKKI